MSLTESADVALLRAIVDAGTLAAAARRMAVSPASVSMRLADLERRLGVVLLRRTSRHAGLTAEGERYLTTALPVLQLLEAAEEQARHIRDGDAELVGTIALSAPRDLGTLYVVDMVEDFMRQHPRIDIFLSLTDEVVDLTRSGIDLAIRYGEMPDSSALTVSALADNHRVICASPAYLDRVGRPDRPADLAKLNCLCLHTRGTRIDRWPAGRSTVAVSGDRSTNDGALIRRWALAGLGVVLKSWWDVREELAAGRLEALFPKLPRIRHPLRLMRPADTGIPIRFRKLSDHLKTSFRRLQS